MPACRANMWTHGSCSSLQTYMFKNTGESNWPTDTQLRPSNAVATQFQFAYKCRGDTRPVPSRSIPLKATQTVLIQSITVKFCIDCFSPCTRTPNPFACLARWCLSADSKLLWVPEVTLLAGDWVTCCRSSKGRRNFLDQPCGNTWRTCACLILLSILRIQSGMSIYVLRLFNCFW